jgi:hypothetical protein
MNIETSVVYHNFDAGFDVRAVPNPDHCGEPGDRFVVQTRIDANTPWERPVERCSDAGAACERVAEYLTWTQSPHSR